MSHASSRSKRVKDEARTRPDVVWRDGAGEHQERLNAGSSQDVLKGGSELSQLVAKADAHLVAMRKIVQ